MLATDEAKIPPYKGPTAERSTKVRYAKRYPWSQWTNGQIWTAHQGVDFLVDAESFRCHLYVTAKRRNLRVTVSQCFNVVTFQFLSGVEIRK